ncbi:major capsid protein [Desulfocurvus sp. DL9XJH121]
MADTITGTLKELSNEYAKKQPKQVDNITEETPVLASVPFEAASHALWNVYDEVSDISGGGFVDMDAPLQLMEVNSNLKRVDLQIMGGKMWCPEDKAKAFGGKEKYFAKKQPKALRNLGVTTEQAIIYDNLLAYSQDQGKLLDAGATDSTGFLILAVRWVPGETTGLYSPDGFKQGAMLDTQAINGGNLYENADGVLGYGLRMKGYFGMQMANPETVAALVNVNQAHMPTAMQVDDLLDMVRAASNTHLYCHRKALSILAQVGKGAAFQMVPGDQHVDRRIAEWNGVGITTSYNFADGAETYIEVPE